MVKSILAEYPRNHTTRQMLASTNQQVLALALLIPTGGLTGQDEKIEGGEAEGLRS